MVWSVIRNVQKSLKYRGGWKGLFEHMYTNGDYPFKYGTYMGSDSAGNRYYENRVDYTFGMHRWVEPGDIHNFDSSSIDPDWHGWMTSMNDEPPCAEEAYIAKKTDKVDQMCVSNAPEKSNVGLQGKVWNFHNMHNQSQVRSRGYGIGNPIVGLPPNVKDGYYTQPGSPYNDASLRPLEFVGSLDKDGGRKYKSEKWAERLRTEEEKAAIEAKSKNDLQDLFADLGAPSADSRGGTAVGPQ
jgi:NADH:ubiquinone oxidoreductase subunit